MMECDAIETLPRVRVWEYVQRRKGAVPAIAKSVDVSTTSVRDVLSGIKTSKRVLDAARAYIREQVAVESKIISGEAAS